MTRLEASDLPRLRKEYDLANESAYSVLADVCVDGYMDLLDLAERLARKLEALAERNMFERGASDEAREHAKTINDLAGATLRIAALESQLAARRAGERERVEKLLDLLREISPPVWDDPRMDYVNVQIDKQTYGEIQAALADESLKGE